MSQPSENEPKPAPFRVWFKEVWLPLMGSSLIAVAIGAVVSRPIFNAIEKIALSLGDK